MLSLRAKYALKALNALANGPEQQAWKSRDIASRLAAPLHFIEAILFELRGAGFLKSVRGRSGGYLLSQSANMISYADVIRAIDGPIALVHCVSNSAFRACEDCQDIMTCPIRAAMRAARDAAAGVLEAIDVANGQIELTETPSEMM